jgi:hypothetical protein
MLTKILLLLVDFLSAMFLPKSNSQEFALIITELSQKILKRLIFFLILLIIFASSLLLLIADVLLQQYTINQITFSPLTTISLSLIFLCALCIFFLFKPIKSAASATRPSENINSESLSGLLDACSVLILQYANDCKEKTTHRAPK